MQEINWHEHFYYDETSPSCLRWKIDRWAGRKHTTLIRAKDSIAGCQSTEGYWMVNLQGTKHQAHRIILALHDVVIHNLLVDHIDGDTSNNSLKNLRPVNAKQNSRNAKKPFDNTSGVCGVSWNNILHKSGIYYTLYATAHWRKSNGIRGQKSFSVAKYGLVPAFAMACDVREREISTLSLDGYPYSERHGR